MMNREIKLTKEGFQKLSAQMELEKERLVEAETILAAQQDEGDDYDGSGLEDAKRAKTAIEDRLHELEETLALAVVIETGEGSSKLVALGSTVKLKEEKTGREMQVQLVSGAEVAVHSAGVRKVSEDSPLGVKLIGRKKNELFIVDVERGQLKYKVLEIS